MMSGSHLPQMVLERSGSYQPPGGDGEGFSSPSAAEMLASRARSHQGLDKDIFRGGRGGEGGCVQKNHTSFF